MTNEQIKKMVDGVFCDVRSRNFLTSQTHDLEKPLLDIKSMLIKFYESHNLLLTNEGEIVFTVDQNEDYERCLKLDCAYVSMMGSIGKFLSEFNRELQDDLIHERLENLKSILSSKES